MHSTRWRWPLRCSSLHAIQRARRNAKRRGRKPHRCQPTVCRGDEIAQLTPGEGRHPPRMLLRDQGTPCTPLLIGLDQHNGEVRDCRHCRRHRNRRRQCSRKTPRCRGRRCASRSRQLNLTGALKGAQRLHAARQLKTTLLVGKVEHFAHATSHRAAARAVRLRKNLLETDPRSRCVQRTVDLILYHHAGRDTGKIRLCPVRQTANPTSVKCP